MTQFSSESPSYTGVVRTIFEIIKEILLFILTSKKMSARHLWHESWDSIPEIITKQEELNMNKHLQQQQIFDSFFSDEDLPILSGDEPCMDPDCVDEEKIYEIIDQNGYEDISMNELELDDYDDFMQL